MPPESSAEIKFEIGHVLFIDIVGYSKGLINEQSDALQKLKELVRGTEQFRLAKAEGKLVGLPTGDGGALVFRTSPEAPLLCAIEISQKLKRHPELQVRMGVHSGPVNEITDLNEQANIAGAGINIAQRVMDCGDAGHILVSKHVAEDLEEYERWRPLLHHLGSCEVKHGVRIDLTNLYSDGVGNPQLPKKLRALKKHRAHVRWAAVAVAVVLLAAVAGAFLYLVRKEPARSLGTVTEKSIAVLPFANLSSDRENVYFTDGVQDEILSHVARIADLKVISRTSVMHYKSDAPRNRREIAQQLGVAHLLEGSVQRAANKVRVIAQLIDARTDAHLWAQTYDRDLADVFAIQSEIAKAIADQLHAKLLPDEKAALEERPTADVIAFDLYSQAKTLILMVGGNMTTENKNYPHAVDLLKQALARDPNFFLAHCLLARAHGRIYFFHIDRTPERLAQAHAALDTAARLRPEAGETHLARAYHLYSGYRDYPGALAELESAQRTLPNEAQIYELQGYITRRQGKHGEGLRYLEQALQLDPRNFLTLQQIALSYLNVRRYRDAADSYDRAISIYPDNFDAQYSRAYLDIYWKADTSPMRRLFDELREKDPAAFEERAHELFELAVYERDVSAAQAALKALGNDTFRDNALVYNAHANAGLVALLAGNDETARTAYGAALEEQEKTVQAQPDSGPPLALLAFYQAQMSRKEEALGNGRRALRLLPVEKDALNGPLLIRVFAATAARLGEKDLALEHLARAVQLPAGAHYGELKLLVDWDPLRGDPRFDAILASLAPK